MSGDGDTARARSVERDRESPRGREASNEAGGAALPAGSSSWVVPHTSHTGGSWSVIDGFATPEECLALIASADGLQELDEPLERYKAPPTLCDYRSADASGLTISAARTLAARAAQVTSVPVNAQRDCVMLARTSKLRTKDSDDKHESNDDDTRSVDSEGFLLNPTTDGGDGEKSGDKNEIPSLINVHHDHNRDAGRQCTVFVYLSGGDENPSTTDETNRPYTNGGETFFPCVVNDNDQTEQRGKFSDTAYQGGFKKQDQLCESLKNMGEKGVHTVWAGSTDAEEKNVISMCVERFGKVKTDGVTPRGAPSGVFVSSDGKTNGMVVTPRVGRAVVFWHGEDAGSCPEAWHAPSSVTGTDPKYLMTFFKVGDGLKKVAGVKTEEPASALGVGPSVTGVKPTGKPATAAPTNEESDSESDHDAMGALAVLGAVAAASGKKIGTRKHGFDDDGEIPTTAITTAAALQSLQGGVLSLPGGNIPAAKHKGLCLVDGCIASRKQPSNNNRLPLTCPGHAGARAVSYQGVLSRECQACRTFHELSHFDRDNKTCETRLLRKKLRYRARVIGADADVDTETLAGNMVQLGAVGQSTLNKAFLIGGKIPIGSITQEDEQRLGIHQCWESIHDKKPGLLGGVPGLPEGAGDVAGLPLGPGHPAVGAKRPLEYLAGLGGSFPDNGEKKKGARRGRPPGSTNKNWTSKIVAASYQEQQRKRLVRDREATQAAEQAFVNLPPHLRAAYIQNLQGQQLLHQTPQSTQFGHAAIAQAAQEAAATFAQRHAALAKAQSVGGTSGSAEANAAVSAANAASSQFHDGSLSYHHAILAAQAHAHLRSQQLGLSFPFGGHQGVPGLAGLQGLHGGAGVGALSGLLLSSLAQLGLGGGLSGAGDLNALAEAQDPAAAARANHLMQIANAMDPAVRADLLGQRAAQGGGTEGVPLCEDLDFFRFHDDLRDFICWAFVCV